jgi:hypothetical protein
VRRTDSAARFHQFRNNKQSCHRRPVSAQPAVTGQSVAEGLTAKTLATLDNSQEDTPVQLLNCCGGRIFIFF